MQQHEDPLAHRVGLVGSSLSTAVALERRTARCFVVVASHLQIHRYQVAVVLSARQQDRSASQARSAALGSFGPVALAQTLVLVLMVVLPTVGTEAE